MYVRMRACMYVCIYEIFVGSIGSERTLTGTPAIPTVSDYHSFGSIGPCHSPAAFPEIALQELGHTKQQRFLKSLLADLAAGVLEHPVQ